jgi:hypothetical protein
VPVAGHWSTLADVRARLRRRWDRGEFLGAWAGCAPFEPIAVPLSGPSTAELAARFDEVRDWVAHWASASQEQPIVVRTRSTGHRSVGANELPSHVEVEGYDALWRLLGVSRLVSRFDQLRAETAASTPGLDGWSARRPMRVLENAEGWTRLVRSASWIAQSPADGSAYLREIPVPGVDTKFIEQNRTILADLVDELVADRADRAYPPNQFARRYGFAVKPTLVRFRSLDPRRPLYAGVTDLTVRADEFAAAAPDVGTVFIVENDVTFLAFPKVVDAVALFGGGFAVSSVAALPWLQSRRVVYWGDIDTHGFVALDRLRALVGHTESFLMDEATMLAHRGQWVCEGVQASALLTHLTPSESALYRALQDNEHGDRVRLEQERVQYPAIEAALGS